MLNHYWHNSRLTRALALLLLLLVLLAQGVVFAHTELVSAEPAVGERLTEAPSQITLKFNEPLGAGSSITLRDAALREISLNSSSANGEMLMATVDSLETGAYTVEYNVVSADGHAINGSYQFGIDLTQRRAIPPIAAVGVGIVVSIFGRMAFRQWQQRPKNEDQE